MSTNQVSTLTYPEPTSPTRRKLDKFSIAVIDFLTTGSSDAFDHAVSICYQLLGHLYVTDNEPVTIFEDKPWKKSSVASTRFFIYDFLLTKMSPFAGMGLEQLEDAAYDGEFAHWPTECLYRVKDAIRRFYRFRIREFPMTEDEIEYLQEKRFEDNRPPLLTLGEAIAARQDALNGNPVYTVESSVLQRWFADKKGQLESLLSASDLETMAAVVSANTQRRGASVLAIADRKQISPQHARKHISRLASELRHLLMDPATRRIFDGVVEAVRLEKYIKHRVRNKKFDA